MDWNMADLTVDTLLLPASDFPSLFFLSLPMFVDVHIIAREMG